MAAEDVVVTLSQRGYIKRQQIGTFRSQRRGGKGKLAMITREEDAVRHLLVANTHDHILFFTNRGRVFITRVHTLPEASRQAEGCRSSTCRACRLTPASTSAPSSRCRSSSRTTTW